MKFLFTYVFIVIVSLIYKMSNKYKSWVWLYAKRQGDKAYCDLCTENENNEFCCIGGSTGSLGRHLKTIHGIKPLTTVTRRYVLCT